MDGSGEVGGGFGGVGGAACCEVAVFGVIEDEVFHPEVLSHFARFERCAVMLLVGLEDVALGIQAERFVHEPVGADGIFAASLIERFVAETHQRCAGGEGGAEAELQFFGRADVESGHADVAYRECLIVGHEAHDYLVADARGYLLGEGEAADSVEGVEHFLRTVKGE